MGYAESGILLRSSSPVGRSNRHEIGPVVANRPAGEEIARPEVYDWNHSFGPAVILRIGSGKARFAIHSTREMAFFLLDQWPGPRTRKHAEACRTCRDAIEGRIPAASARTALVEAVREAGILIEDEGFVPVVSHAAASTTDEVKSLS
jgi:hypothetical protein